MIDERSTTPSAPIKDIGAATPPIQGGELVCDSPQDTFDLGRKLGQELIGGEIVLLFGGLGAGKTLLTKGILSGLQYNVDEVTSPSFTFVNLYNTNSFDVYHIDLWRLDAAQDAGKAVGLDEILENENAVTIIEWADRLEVISGPNEVIEIRIDGDGDEPRRISIHRPTAEKLNE